MSLARAVYSRASVLFLDDVLSAGTFSFSLPVLLYSSPHVTYPQSTPTPRTISTTNVLRAI